MSRLIHSVLTPFQFHTMFGRVSSGCKEQVFNSCEALPSQHLTRVAHHSCRFGPHSLEKVPTTQGYSLDGKDSSDPKKDSLHLWRILLAQMRTENLVYVTRSLASRDFV